MPSLSGSSGASFSWPTTTNLSINLNQLSVYDLAVHDIKAENAYFTSASISSSMIVPSITASNLIVNGVVTASEYVGTLLTSYQPNISKVGDLSNLQVIGATTSTSYQGTSMSLSGVATCASYQGGSMQLSGIVTSSGYFGSILTPNQSAISTVGTLSNLAVTGVTTSGSFQGISASLTGVATVAGLSTPSIKNTGGVVCDSLCFLDNATDYANGIYFGYGTSVSKTNYNSRIIRWTGNNNNSFITIQGSGSFLVGTSGDASSCAQFDLVNSRLRIGASTSLTAPQYTLDVAGDMNIQNNSSVLRVGGVPVISSIALGTTVLSSSLTSVGTLGNLNVSGVTTSASLNVSGIATAAGGLSGTILQPNQSNITTVGTLGSLAVTNGVTCTSIFQSTPNILVNHLPTATQTLTSGSSTTVNISANLLTVGSPAFTYTAGAYSNTSGVNKIVLVTYNVQFAANSTNSREAWIYVNSNPGNSPGGTILGYNAASAVGGGGSTVVSGSAMFQVGPIGSFIVQALQNSGGNLNINQTGTTLTMHVF